MGTESASDFEIEKMRQIKICCGKFLRSADK